MSEASEAEEIHVGALELEGRTWNVSLSVQNDGIGFVGHLTFSDDAWEDDGVRDQGGISGQTAADIVGQARALTSDDLTLRFRRAQGVHRRYHGLRRLTDEVLADIRHLNKVAISMRAGLLDVDEAASEIDATEQRLHQRVDQLRHVAGMN